ncbi:hypothetical protein [Microbacterium sp. PA5]|uniref:hypothetical protein n=1 Tax=Microbacterium sp. PA5 TaxID=3416654 RepID=UPI003CF9D1F8
MVIDLAYPFEGRWRALNSPVDRVPSHGTTRFASSYAIDFVFVGEEGRSAPFTAASLVRPEPPERFGGFGRPLRDDLDLARARAVPVTFDGTLPRSGAIVHA